MRKAKSILKYIAITSIVLSLTVITSIIVYFIKTNAPIISGEIMYNIEYKENLNLDIYSPTNKKIEKSPVIFYIHGGAWVMGNKLTINSNRINGAINTLRENGYTVICPNYTLGKKGKSPFPDCILDIYDAIDWAKKNAKRYNLDIKNIGLLGESAGAQIAMMIAFSDSTLNSKKYSETKFNFLIDVYGPSDLATIYYSPEIKKLNNRLNKFLMLTNSNINLEDYVFGFDPAQDSIKAKNLIEKYSPVNSLSKNNFPTLIIHGTNDQIVSVEQSIVLKSKMDSLGIVNEIHLIDGMDHSFRKATQVQKDAIQLLITDFVLESYKNNILGLNKNY